MTLSEVISGGSVLKVGDLALEKSSRAEAVKQGWRLCKDGKKRGPGILPRTLEETKQALWSKIAIGEPNDCWIWNAGINACGRPIFWLAGKQWIAYRVAWLFVHGWLRLDLDICHTCDNGICMNPRHLFVGTPLDNMHDMIRKRRKRYGEQCGNPTLKLTELEVREIRRIWTFGTARQLARRFGVTHSTIVKIVNGKSWKHLLPDELRFAGIKPECEIGIKSPLVLAQLTDGL